MNRNLSNGRLLLFFFIPGILFVVTSCGYLQVNPPPDVRLDEASQVQSAWMAAAANVLAAAGYGYGPDVQAKAENIFNDLSRHYGENADGWADAAIQWWLSSMHNEWQGNPYKLVTVIGHKEPPRPWQDPAGPGRIANLLREGHYVMAGISWHDPANPGAFSGGHVLNCWGDDMREKMNDRLTPGHLRVTDCYRNRGGILQTYPYLDFERTASTGTDLEGWYLAYDDHPPFIKNIILLSKVQYPLASQKPLHSGTVLRVINEMGTRASTMTIGCSMDNPLASSQSNVILDGGKRLPGKEWKDPEKYDSVSYVWTFDRKELESSKEFIISIESSGTWDGWSKIGNGRITDRQGNEEMDLPSMAFRVEGFPVNPRYQASHATGGYFLFHLAFTGNDSTIADKQFSFDAYFIKQYPADIDPERPVVRVSAPQGMLLQTLKAGHSYGYLNEEERLNFTSWMTIADIGHTFEDDTLSVPLNLIGLLPYPEGDNYAKRAVR